MARRRASRAGSVRSRSSAPYPFGTTVPSRAPSWCRSPRAGCSRRVRYPPPHLRDCDGIPGRGGLSDRAGGQDHRRAARPPSAAGDRARGTARPSAGFLSRRGAQGRIGALARALGELTRRTNDHIELLQSFSADVSHELKNRLASIRTAAEMMAEADSPEERRRFQDLMVRDVARLERLVSGLRDVARVEGQIEADVSEAIDLRALVGGLLASMNATAPNGVRLDLVTEAAPPAWSPRPNGCRRSSRICSRTRSAFRRRAPVIAVTPRSARSGRWSRSMTPARGFPKGTSIGCSTILHLPPWRRAARARRSRARDCEADRRELWRPDLRVESVRRGAGSGGSTRAPTSSRVRRASRRSLPVRGANRPSATNEFARRR